VGLGEGEELYGSSGQGNRAGQPASRSDVGNSYGGLTAAAARPSGASAAQRMQNRRCGQINESATTRSSAFADRPLLTICNHMVTILVTIWLRYGSKPAMRHFEQ
jgi:hypothetical protein